MRTKIDYALCNAKMQPMLMFNNEDSLHQHMECQKERHGKYPSGIPCKIVTTIKTEQLQWPTKLD